MKTIEKSRIFISRMTYCLMAVFVLGFASLQASDSADIQNTSTKAFYSDLQTAINAASSGDVIKVSGKHKGNFVITKSLTLLGDDAVLDGGKAGTVLTVTTISGTQVVVTLKDFTIQNGLSGTSGGGGILNVNATLILKNVDVSNNKALLGNGAGIMNLTVSGPGYVATLSLFDCEVSENITAESGGGIANVAGILSVDNSKIKGNVAYISGGGILSFAGHNSITNSRIANNAAFPPLTEPQTTGQGGGLENRTASVTTLENVKFVNNRANQAGGIYNGVAGSQITIRKSSLHGNTTLTLGGALMNDTNATATILKSKIRRNGAANGGGILNNVSATLNLSDVDVEHNIPNNIVDL